MKLILSKGVSMDTMSGSDTLPV